MGVVDTAVSWALQIASDNTHGYSQQNRWGPDYDCSSFVISAFREAGLKINATYTGNMRAGFKAAGFVEVNINERRKGDVLLNDVNHTALCVSRDTIVQASSDYDGRTGDSGGNEIRQRGYYDYPWNCCLRYMGAESVPVSAPASSGGGVTITAAASGKKKQVTSVTGMTMLRSGSTGYEVKVLQSILYLHGYSVDVDGQFYAQTANAVRSYQGRNGLEADGIVGNATWTALLKGD